MEQRESVMEAKVVHCVASLKEVLTRNGYRYIAELEFIGEKKQEFWMSVKQGEQLQKCYNKLSTGYSNKRNELHIVVDTAGDKPRFVWCGNHTPGYSDVPFLEEKFGVECYSPYIGFPSAAPREVLSDLVDA